MRFCWRCGRCWRLQACSPSRCSRGPVAVVQALAERAPADRAGAGHRRQHVCRSSSASSRHACRPVFLSLVMGWCTRAWEFLNPVVRFLPPSRQWRGCRSLCCGWASATFAIVVIFLAAFFQCCFPRWCRSSYRSGVSEGVEKLRPGQCRPCSRSCCPQAVPRYRQCAPYRPWNGVDLPGCRRDGGHAVRAGFISWTHNSLHCHCDCWPPYHLRARSGAYNKPDHRHLNKRNCCHPILIKT